jgi:elongator complex protein 3
VAPPLGGSAGPESLHRTKLEHLKAHPGAPIPSNVEFLETLSPAEKDAFQGQVVRKPTRSLSGVAVVAVMTSPARCPHGRCTYCPGGVENRSPQSYTGEEPSALRGAQFQYDSRAIARHRIETLEAIGHPTSKVEVIVMGGTFPARPRPFQEATLKGIYDGLDGAVSTDLNEALERNARGAHRVVGLTVETRPDWCDRRVLPFLLDAGVTRVELGVECLTDEVLEATGRAHASGEVGTATREARDRGLKVGYHWMLGLPGMDPGRDLADFRRLWAEEEFRPDFLKIYPTLVLPATELFESWKAGRYQPYDTPTVVDLLAQLKRELPPWVRIHRIQRDIPARLIAAGVRTSNVRQLALARLAENGEHCRCLRCREAGRRASPPPETFQLNRRAYRANGGEELFLSFEEPTTDTVAGYLRLRFPSAATEGGLDGPVVRELKVLGRAVPVGTGASGAEAFQHRGFGRRLIEEAEGIARERGADRLFVRSAVGTWEYYARLGFERYGNAMVRRW